MLPFFIHVFHFAEVYTVLLAWVVIPLAYFACYLFFQEHYGMFLPTRASEHERADPETIADQEQRFDGAA